MGWVRATLMVSLDPTLDELNLCFMWAWAPLLSLLLSLSLTHLHFLSKKKNSPTAVLVTRRIIFPGCCNRRTCKGKLWNSGNGLFLDMTGGSVSFYLMKIHWAVTYYCLFAICHSIKSSFRKKTKQNKQTKHTKMCAVKLKACTDFSLERVVGGSNMYGPQGQRV